MEESEINEILEFSKRILTKNEENCREYELPYGWKKVGRRRKIDKDAWDFYLHTPDR